MTIAKIIALAKLAGKGGSGLSETSAPHQQLVTGADGKAKWEERTHYRYISRNEIVQSGIVEYKGVQQLDWVDRPYGVYNELKGIPYVVGNTYIVTWDGVDYPCVMKSNTGFHWYYWGDSKFTECPFYIRCPHMDRNGNAEVFWASTDTNTHTFSMREADHEEVITLPSEYLADGAQTYNQLVTNADGKMQWEERTHHMVDRITLKLSPSFDKANSDGSYSGCLSTNNEVQREVALAIGQEFANIVKDSAHNCTFYWDGVKYNTNTVTVKLFVWNKGQILTSALLNNSPLPFKLTCRAGDNNTCKVDITYDDGQDHIFELELLEPTVKTLDAKYLPAVVPVIQTASVGQTIAVKAVDENGRPIEWEAVDGDFDTRKQIVMIPAFDETGENPREEDKVSDESITYGYSNNNRDLTWTLKPLQPDEVANIVQSNLDEYVLVLKGEKYEDWFANRLSTSRDFFVFERKPYLQTEWVNVGDGTSLAFVVSERILLYLTGEDAGKMVLQVNSRTVYDASM